MKITRRWLSTALAPVAFGAGAALAVNALASVAAPSAGSRLPVSTQAYQPSVANCFGRGQVKPASMTLSCADGYSSLTGLHWRSWRSSARGEGTWLINDCVPFCARGTVHRFPASIVLSAPERVGHARVPRYTKLTLTLPHTRCYTEAGRFSCYPATTTRDLLPQHPAPPPVMSAQLAMVPLTTAAR